MNIRKAIPAVGRIELPGHPSIPYGGTGFVVGRDLLMTNRHVAELFANGLGRRQLVFKTGRTAGIDFQQRVDGGTQFLNVAEVVLIHPYWDMALLRVHDLPDTIEPLRLAASRIRCRRARSWRSAIPPSIRATTSTSSNRSSAGCSTSSG